MKNIDCEKLKSGKLCTLAKQKKMKKIKQLSIEPKFICKKCARVAHCEKNLCKPKEF